MYAADAKQQSATVLSDVNTRPFGIKLGSGDFSVTKNNDSLEISFGADKEQKVNFTPEEIDIGKEVKTSFMPPVGRDLDNLFQTGKMIEQQFDRHPPFYISPQGDYINLGWKI